MLKLLKNLKNSFWSVLVIIIFLIIQSQTDLALPEYTSKIVNVGIGQDDTLYAKIDGYVKFERVGKDKKQASVYPDLEK